MIDWYCRSAVYGRNNRAHCALAVMEDNHAAIADASCHSLTLSRPHGGFDRMTVRRPPPAHPQSPDLTQLERIIGTLSDGVIRIAPDGHILSANQAALDMHGCDTLADLGMTVKAYGQRFDLRFKGGSEISKDATPMARLCRGESFEDLVVEVRKHKTREPDWIHRERGLILKDAADEPECLVLIICDATEAYEAEERFESMFNANPAPALIVRLDDLRFVRVNEGFLELSGWDRDQIIGHTLYDLDILAEAQQRDKAKALLKVWISVEKGPR
ncbi:PAS domain-containing protein [Sphingomonas oryzagri]